MRREIKFDKQEMRIYMCAERLAIKPANLVAMEAGGVILDTKVD